MKPNELVEDFSNRFLHLCCEIYEEDINRDFLKQGFEHLILISLHGELEPLYFPTSATLVNHTTPIISEEEPIIHFALCPHPFPVPMRVPP